ncbi:MAG: hypothetical protein Q9163_006536, partial [Psora crenata]
RQDQQQQQQQRQQYGTQYGTSANTEPLGTNNRVLPDRPDTTLPPKPAVIAQAPKTTYESKPQVRDLRKEATKAFVPSVVKRKLDAVKGRGPLLEEEDLAVLESEGYVEKREKREHGTGAGNSEKGVVDASTTQEGYEDTEMAVDAPPSAPSEPTPLVGVDAKEAMRLREEFERFQREVGPPGDGNNGRDVGDDGAGHDEWEERVGMHVTG